MLETDPSFRPVPVTAGYPPLEDLGLLGDGATVALVGLDGSIYWLCLPRFDSEPVFCGLLDRNRGGHFTIAPDELTQARQRYEPDTGVLVTELRSPTGLVRLTDAVALRSGADLTEDVPGGRGELVRSAVVLDGNVRLWVDLEPRGGAETWMTASGLRLTLSRRPDLQLHLRSSRALSGLHGTYDLKQGDALDLVLSWGRFHRHHRFDAGTMLEGTAAAWRRWMTCFSYEGLQEPLVRRAAITLKLCDHWVNGSLVAAPTSSLPAPVGGVRNWDYRYTWVRDAAFTVFALRRIGFGNEADAFLGWVLDAFEQSSQPRIMYDLDGNADAIIAQYATVGARAIDAFTRCRLIARYGTGVDIVDVDAATRRGILVTNVPNDWCQNEVADHAMALLLAAARKICVYDRATRAGVWRWQSGEPIHRTQGHTLGLLSFGAIAQAIAARATAFGMRVTAHDPYMAPDDVAAHGASPVSFDDLIEHADYLVIQAPLTKETYHLIGEAELRRMKPTMILVNTARGPIVNDEALYLALKEGWIAGAGLDDIEEEPAKQRDWTPANPLFGLDNVIITPHAAYYSEEAIGTVRDFAAHEVATGQPPLSPVNAAQLAMLGAGRARTS